MNIIKKIYYPEIFQGKNKKKNYFEGWYFKNIDKEKQNALAIIPGIAFGSTNADAHAFIQILYKSQEKLSYIKYDANDFKFNENKFEIEIGKNYFSSKEMTLNINEDEVSIEGRLIFDNIISFPKNIFRPGIMGPFSFIPFMECYHGVVNIHHESSGCLRYNNNIINYDGGYGYIEKDWGKSFPRKWIWFQSNHFNKDDAAVMFSIAEIPWLSKSFIGFISFLRIKNMIYYFATYTNAKIKKLDICGKCLDIIIRDKDYEIRMSVENDSYGQLKAPFRGEMSRNIYESINAKVKVKMIDKHKNFIFEGIGTNAGIEIMCEENDFKTMGN